MAARLILILLPALLLTSCQPVTVRFRVFYRPSTSAKHDKMPRLWHDQDRTKP